MVAAPTTEIRHRADHRPRLDSSAVRGLVAELLKVMVYILGPSTGVTVNVLLNTEALVVVVVVVVVLVFVLVVRGL